MALHDDTYMGWISARNLVARGQYMRSEMGTFARKDSIMRFLEEYWDKNILDNISI
jgi:hypothetical protein